jgi:uncharacterized protein YaiL (DUF2058 family)
MRPGRVRMNQTFTFYDARAKECAAEAAIAKLDMVRERCLRSEKTWRTLADQALRVQAEREKAERAKSERQEVERLEAERIEDERLEDLQLDAEALQEAAGEFSED